MAEGPFDCRGIQSWSSGAEVSPSLGLRVHLCWQLGLFQPHLQPLAPFKGRAQKEMGLGRSSFWNQ